MNRGNICINHQIRRRRLLLKKEEGEIKVEDDEEEKQKLHTLGPFYPVWSLSLENWIPVRAPNIWMPLSSSQEDCTTHLKFTRGDAFFLPNEN